MNPQDFDEANTTLESPASVDEDDVGGLPALQGSVTLPSGQQLPALVSRWSPTDREREAIANGDDVYLHVLGTRHPSVMLTTEIYAQGAVSSRSNGEEPESND